MDTAGTTWLRPEEPRVAASQARRKAIAHKVAAQREIHWQRQRIPTMPTEPPLLHVTFGCSAAGSLKMALETLRRGDEVQFLGDDLSFGPIDPGEPHARMQWAVDELGFEDDPELVEHVEEFWDRVTTSRTEIVAWLGSRCTTEYCGLLELLWRVQHAPVSVVDVADIEFTGRDGRPRPDTSLSFATVGDREIVDHQLIDRAVRVSATARDAYRVEWQSLRSENGAFRVFTPTGMISAPITYFDDTIISCITTEWQSCARVVGCSVATLSSGLFRQCSSDIIIVDRLLALIDAGVVEGRNEKDLWSMRESWVRRKAVHL